MVWKPGQFPEDPTDFNPDDKYADPVALMRKRDAVAREKVIAVEKAKLLKEKLRQCYIKEGVNHFQNCKQWADLYLESIKGIGFQLSNSGENDKHPQNMT